MVFPRPHVVGQDAARLEFLEEAKPGEAFLLVLAELALEARGRLARFGEIVLEDASAERFEGLVLADVVFVAERGVEKDALGFLEA